MAGGLVLKVYKAAFVHDRHFVQPGQSSLVGNEWRVAVKDGGLILSEVQLEGKKRMLAADLLRGNANLATMLLH